MKNVIPFILLLMPFSNLYAIDLREVDSVVKDHVYGLWHDECENIVYEYEYVLYEGNAFDRGFYEPNVKFSDFMPAISKDDVKVKVNLNVCGNADGYYLTLRKHKESYDVIHYSSYFQPE